MLYKFLAVILLFILMKDSAAAQEIPKRIAILPFTWSQQINPAIQERFPEALELTREIFFNSFSGLGYEDVPLNMVDRWISAQEILQDDYTNLLAYGVDGIIKAEITQISISTGGIIGRTSAGLRAQLIQIPTMKVFWENEGKGSRYGGIVLNSGQLVDAFQSIRIAPDAGKIEYILVLKDLSSELLLTLPPVVPYPHVPEIITSHIRETTTPKGEPAVQVFLKGDPGLLASFDLPNGPLYIPMTEMNPGQYYGFSLIIPNQTTNNVRVRLQNYYGIQNLKEIEQ